MRYFLSLGSNLGEKQANLEKAILSLRAEGVKVRKCSSLYETEPVGLLPSASQEWFINQVVEADIDLEPIEVLHLVKRIETQMGRRTSVSKGPRIIDIDILLAGDCVVQTEELTIPHPRLEKRNFVLTPFLEISPETEHPVLRMMIKELAGISPDKSEVRKIDR